MAPVERRKGDPGQKRNVGKQNSQVRRSGKQPWRRDPHMVRGSIQEGQGFAFWRKQKIQRDYRRLLKKEKDAKSQKTVEYTENFPEHLKHLYLAEEEMLKKQRKPKDYHPVLLERKPKDYHPVLLEETSSTTKFNMRKRELKAKTSNQKAKEEYERIKAKREEKKEAARRRKEEKEKAQMLYKQKKMEAYKILSKRTRKGQPNLNLQMEYLLQKIQQKP